MSYRLIKLAENSGHIGLAVLFVLLTVALMGCKSDATPTEIPQPTQVTAAAAIERDVTDWDEFTGRLEAVETVEVRPRVTGYIDGMHFAEGGLVKKGQLLFTIDPRPYRAELAKAEAELARAQAQVELNRRLATRAESLVGVKAISQEAYEQRLNAAREAEANLEAAKAAVAAARLNLEYTQITSPIDGRIGRAQVTAGNLVTGGPNAATLLATVVSVDPMYVTFEGDERVFLKYADLARQSADGTALKRYTVKLGLASEEGYPHAGELHFVDNQVDPRTGTIKVRALVRNADALFTPGLFARVQVFTGEQRKAVLVDDRAIGTDQSQRFVYVINAANTVEYRKVKPGRLHDGLRVIDQGLAPGEWVVVNGVQRVRPGMPVGIERVAMDVRHPATEKLAGTSLMAAETKPL
jgi:RND family efflux transporter MFP subunit